MILVDDDSRVREFVEKPTLAELREHFHVATDEEFRKLPLMTNAGLLHRGDPAAARARDRPGGRRVE